VFPLQDNKSQKVNSEMIANWRRQIRLSTRHKFCIFFCTVQGVFL